MLAFEQPLNDFGLFTLFFNASFLVKLVIILLIFCSILSWAIAINRFILYRNTLHNIKVFENLFWSGKNFEQIANIYENVPKTDISLIFTSAIKEYHSFKGNIKDQGKLQQSISSVIDNNFNFIIDNLQRYIYILAIIASVTPFIGLFGTVIGIMHGFSALSGAKASSLAVVAPNIAEALLATAIGLFAAIPAVIFYNISLAMVNNISFKLENFIEQFYHIIFWHNNE